MAPSTPLLYNPAAGRGRGAEVARKAQRLLDASGVPVDLVATSGPGGARSAAAKLAGDGVDRLLVVGGDGTLSEAADGVLTEGGRPELGFLPGGTGNDFLRDFGITGLASAVEHIAEGRSRPIDAAAIAYPAEPGGKLTERRHFINVFGVGFMAHVCDLANRRLKWLGERSYTAAVFPELLRLRAPVTRLVADGVVHEEPMNLVAVCNTQYMGNKMHVAPMANPQDGLLDIVLLKAVTRIQLLGIFPRLFEGTHFGSEHVAHERAHKVTLELSEPSPLIADGEVYGTTPVEVEVLPGALQVLV